MLFALTTLTTELTTEILRRSTIDTNGMTTDDWNRTNSQTKCFVCHTEFSEEEKKSSPCLHHDHSKTTDNVVARACNGCNLDMTDEQRQGIPIFFHNGAKYDWKIILKGIGNFIEKYPNS